MSGDTNATGSQGQTALSNQQVSSVTTGGGTAPVSVVNSYGATVNDAGQATSQSGLTDAQGAPAVSSIGANGPAITNTSQTTSGSGSATAVGVTAQNTVNNTSVASVGIEGANNAPVSVRSANQVEVTDSGSASSTSGTSVATGGSATIATGTDFQASAASGTAVSAMPTPSVVPGQAPTSADVNATGVTANHSLSAVLTQSASPTATSGLSVIQTGNVVITTDGHAAAVSGATCAGTGCPAAAASPAGVSTPTGQTVRLSNQTTTLATTGNAAAAGVVAQNTVNTSANVNVHVGGVNNGLINVIIQTVTRIVNLGSAVAGSGSASATGGTAVTLGSGAMPGSPSTGVSSAAASGNARATGAVVTNQVSLGSNTAIHVAGDNYNPIRVLVQFVVRLFSHGSATALSGDAHTAGAAGAGAYGGNVTTVARSGSADATGLDARNQVDLWSNVDVDIDGSNYAPIDIYILFDTMIENIGAARATSGNAVATGSGSTLLLVGGSAPDPPGQSTGSSSSIATTSVSSVGTSGVVNTSVTRSVSGNATGSGVESVVSATNLQVSNAASPGNRNRTAVNLATYAFRTAGSAVAASGPAYIGPIPPSPTSLPSGGSGGRGIAWVPVPLTPTPRPGSPSGITSSGSNGNVTLTAASGGGSVGGWDVIDLPLWPGFPDPDVPPMPGQSLIPAGQGTVIEGRAGAPAAPAIPMGSVQRIAPAASSGAPLVSAPRPLVVVPSARLSVPAGPRVAQTAPRPAAAPSSAGIPVPVLVALALVLLAAVLAMAWRRRAWLAALAHSALGLLHLS